MKTKFQKFLFAVVACVGLLMAAAPAAMAALPDEIGDSITDAKTDALAAIALGGVALLLVAAGGVGFRVAVKYVKRAGGASAFIAGSLIALSSNASAALDGAITTNITAAKTDALAAIALGGVALLLVAAGGVGFRVAVKYVKRAGGAS